MKKKKVFNLLVDISQIVGACDLSSKSKCIFCNQYEIWPYVYDESTHFYGIDPAIIPADVDDLRYRIYCDPRLHRSSFYSYYPINQSLTAIRCFSSIAEAQLMSSIEGFELFVSKKNVNCIVKYISFGEMLKKWKRLT